MKVCVLQTCKNFINETGLFDVFQEINRVEPDQRGATCDNGSNCIDHEMATEGKLRKQKELKCQSAAKLLNQIIEVV